MKRLLTIFAQLVLVAIPVAIFGWLLVQQEVPSGTFVVKHAVGERPPFIDALQPHARVRPPGTIVGDPVTFFVHPQRPFDTVETEVWFKDDGAPIVELGGLSDAQAQAYDLKPLENKLIDDSKWSRLDDGGIVLLQRHKTYASIGDFLSNPPPRSQIATSHYSLARPFRIPGYVASTGVRTTEASWRGSEALKTYVKNETLAFSFAYQDMNRVDGEDPVSIVVTDENGTPVAEARADDDGDVSSDGRASALKRIEVNVPNLPEGVYKVELRVDSDIFFRSYATSEQKVAFLNGIFLADEVGYHEPARAATFFTEGKHLTFSTTHAAGVQEVQVGSHAVAVNEPYAKVSYDVPENGVVQVTAPKGDLLVEGNGHFAFSPAEYFDPDPVSLDWNADLDRLGVNDVIADYVSPKQVDGWTVADVSFDTRLLVEDQGAWKFAFSVPGVDKLGASVEVNRIDMTWKRAPLTWQDVLSALQRKVHL
jgi:hypothetical protein